MKRLVCTASLGLLVALGITVPAVGGTPSATHNVEQVYGFLQAYLGDCPPAEAPQEPFVCHEVEVSAWHIGTSDGPATIPWPKNGWVLLAIRHTLTFPGGGADPAESDVVKGITDRVAVDFDRVHLETAHLVAEDVAMGDGSTIDLDATWTATSPRLLFGNDGPATGEYGLVHHVRDACSNMVFQAHQKYRLAHVHALLNGVAVDDLSDFAFLAYNHFIENQTQPASC